MNFSNEDIYLLVLQNNDGVGVADSSLQKTLGVLGAVGRHDLETGNAAVPGTVILRVLGSDTGSKAVGTTESDVAGLDTARHVVGLRGRVDNLVDGLHGKVEGHELADGVKTGEGSADGQTTETGLGDRCVNDPLLTEAVEQALGDLVTVAAQLPSALPFLQCFSHDILRAAKLLGIANAHARAWVGS